MVLQKGNVSKYMLLCDYNQSLYPYEDNIVLVYNRTNLGLYHIRNEAYPYAQRVRMVDP